MSNDEHIVLNFKPEALNFLNHTLEGHKNLISMTAMNEVMKRELLKDISKIKITLKNAKKGAENENNI